MLKNESVFDDGSWSVVFNFFHPELRSTSCGTLDGFTSLLTELASDAVGFAKDSRISEGEGFGVERSIASEAIPSSLVYESYCVPERQLYWRAEIALTGLTPIGEKILVSVTDADGERIPRADLILLGSRLAVMDGLAAYDLESFQQNLSRTEVFLIFPSGKSVEGTLKFGED